MSQSYSFLFGPVRSRRLGRSLGIDLVPLKVCTWDCPYCQVGATTEKTVIRRDYVPVVGVMAEFDRWMLEDGQADCVTLAGGGEPTLHSHFGEILDAIGTRSKFRRILLSNGSLFALPDVRDAARKADVVKATLSAWDQASFEALHRPHASLKFDLFLDGLKAMRFGFKGEYWLEVFVVPGVNDTPEQMARIASMAAEIVPDRIHLNTAVRPACDGETQPVSVVALQNLAGLFSPVAEVICGSTEGASSEAVPPPSAVPVERILGLIQRHPSRACDIMMTFTLADADVQAALSELLKRGSVRREHRGDADFYCAV